LILAGSLPNIYRLEGSDPLDRFYCSDVLYHLA
jgi:hypothetical protein